MVYKYNRIYAAHWFSGVKGMAIDAQHNEYKANIDKWLLIDDITSGKNLQNYLITINEDDKSEQNKIRNDNYYKRSVFYDIAGYTLKGLYSLPFNKPTEIELDAELEYLISNVDGAGIDLDQQVKSALAETIKKGRCGLFITFPKTTETLTLADKDKYFATINLIKAEQIINWDTKTVGSKTLLSLIVIKEMVTEINEEYEHENIEQITELYLNESNVYSVRVWRKNKKTDDWIIFADEVNPVNAKGQTFNVIPFLFIGSEYNSFNVSEPPLYNLCRQNVAHYRNSADLEDSGYYAGQSQPYMTGLDETHLKLLSNNKTYVGSRNIIGVPSGETFGYATPEPNPLIRQIMLDKIDVMIGLGARFIKDTGAIKTATEAAGDLKTAHSQIQSFVMNVNDAYQQALFFVGEFMGVYTESVYAIDTKFITPTTTAQEIQTIIAGFMQGAIPASDYFRFMKRIDLIEEEKTFEDFSDELNPFSGDMNESQ